MRGREFSRLVRGGLMASWLVVFPACGSDSDSDSPTPAAPATSSGPTSTGAPATSGSPSTTGAAAPASAGCPISADALSTATSLRWEQRERRENMPLETDPSIRATVCVFTAAAAPQFGGDPLVFRTDVVTGRDTAAVRREFADTCAAVSGVTRPGGGGSVCDRNGVVVEGIKGEGDRVVALAFVNADNATAARLTPAFTRILEAVR